MTATLIVYAGYVLDPTSRWLRHIAELAVAWRVSDVRQGLIGTTCIALGALSPAFLPRVSPLWAWLTPLHANGIAWRIGGTALTMLGALLLVDAWFRLRPVDLSTADPRARSLKRRVRDWWASLNNPSVYMAAQSWHLPCRGWAVLFWWSLPLLFAPPVFSQDAYSYAAQGWLVAQHVDPYAVGPGVLPGGYADQVASEWRMTPAPYGPLSLRISEWLVLMCHNSPYLTAWAERIPALLGVLMIGVFIPRIARQMGVDEHLAAWFGILNPMLIISFVGGAHNDSLMMGFVVVAVWMASLSHTTANGPPRWQWWWLVAAVVVGVGAAIKQPAVLTAYALPLIAREWSKVNFRETMITVGRVLASFVVSIGTFCLVTLATGLGFGWINAIGVPGRGITVAPFTMLGLAFHRIASWFGWQLDQGSTLADFRAVGIVIGVLLIGFLALTLARRQPIAFLAWGYLTAAVAGPAIRTWYVQWCVTLLPLTRMTATLVRVVAWGTLVMLGFDTIYMAQLNSAIAVAAGALLAMAWLAWGYQRERHTNAPAAITA